MTRFTLYTERKNRRLTEHIVSTYFDSFTLIEAAGFWLGKREPTLIVEVFIRDVDTDRGKFDQLARAIKHTNQQTCVLISEEEIMAEFV